MESSLRHRLGPIAAVVTLGIGCGFVAVVQMLVSMFVVPVANPKGEPAETVIERPLAPPAKLELSCYDPQIQRVWKELKGNDSFQNGLEYKNGELDCSELLEVKSIDATRDSQNDEILVRGKDLLCGATGNCLLWIVEIRSGHARVILKSAGIDFKVTKSEYDGLRNVRVSANGGNYPDSILEYRFSRGRYRLVRCYQQDKQTLEKWREDCEGWE